MAEITMLLDEIAAGQPGAGDRLLPLVYEQLRRLAASRMSKEKPGATLQATALVHEAWLRLCEGSNADSQWNHRGHFYAAAAEAMRRILVEAARSRSRVRRGGRMQRKDLADAEIAAPVPDESVLAVNDALDALRAVNAEAAELVTLRYFAGFTISEAAGLMNVSPRKADKVWAYARVWLQRRIDRSGQNEEE